MTPSRPLTQEELDAWRSFVAASTRLFGRLDAELRQATGITLGDYEVLVLLSEAPEKRLRMGPLSDAALVSRSRLTYRVDQLESTGLVCRERCDTDRRGAWAILTPAGEDLLRRSFPTHRRGVVSYFADPVRTRLRPFAAALEQVRASLGHRVAPSAATASSGAPDGTGGTGGEG
ncbi:MAG: MarR family winged helix-turn-helix transcriptional regulator, partial [Acidimicrobiia bacterium]